MSLDCFTQCLAKWSDFIKNIDCTFSFCFVFFCVILISYGKIHKIQGILKAFRREWSSIFPSWSILLIYLPTWVQLHGYITNGHVSLCFIIYIHTLCGILVFSHLSLHLLSPTKCPFFLLEY